MSSDEAISQAQQNYDAYNEFFKADLEQSHRGKVALMHGCEVVLILNNADDAYTVGQSQYGVGNFSLVRIGEQPSRLSIVGTLIA